MRKAWLIALTLIWMICLCPVASLALETIEITSTKTNSDGTVTIAWNNPNGGSVTVGSLVLTEGETGNKILVEQNVRGSTYTYTNLAPGMDYALLVLPGLELQYAGIDYVTVPELPKFDQFRFTVKSTDLTYFVPKGNDYSYNYAHDLSNDKIYELMSEKQFWVRMNFSLSPRSRTLTMPTLMVVIAPNGYVATDYGDMEIKSKWESYWRTMIYMNGAFEDLHAQCGEIPAGKYIVRMYMDGCFVSETSFTIRD
ncbi:MAG: hypothetical protein ACI4PG_06055 [Candidatus Ventricola sp.]